MARANRNEISQGVTDWPALPPDSTVLWEYADPRCPQRLFIAPNGDGWQICVVNKLMNEEAPEAPALTDEEVKKIAEKMVAVVAIK